SGALRPWSGRCASRPRRGSCAGGWRRTLRSLASRWRAPRPDRDRADAPLLLLCALRTCSRSLTPRLASILMQGKQWREEKVCAMRTFWRACLLPALLSIHVFAATAAAQQREANDFPIRTIRIIVGFTPGGAPDITARVIAQGLQEQWK